MSRLAGIRKATAPVVVLSEDHSFPEPGWAQAIIDAFREDWCVVAPVFRNANPRTMLSWANLLLEYYPWFEGAERGERNELPGHNTAYRKDQLLAFGDRLEQVFEVESVVHRELRAQGYRMLLEPAAITKHLNFSRLQPVLYLRFHAGRSFAGHRTMGWSFAKRAGYAIGSALIPALRFVRIARMLNESPRYKFLLPGILPALITCLVADGFGEMIGYVSGPGDSPVRLGLIEFNRRRFMNAEDCADLDQRTSASEPEMEPAALMA
jgi:hypothetical protein